MLFSALLHPDSNDSCSFCLGVSHIASDPVLFRLSTNKLSISSLCVSQPLSNQALFQLPRLTKVLFSTFVLAALVVHFAKTAFATTSLETFLWFILRKPHLRPLPQKLFCGSFCKNRVCDHFLKSFFVVHFAKTAFATTSAKAFLWFISQKPHLRPLPQKLSCGSFRKKLICSHFHGNFFAKTPFLCKRCSCAYSLLSPAGQRVVGKGALRRFLAALETAMLFRGPTPG